MILNVLMYLSYNLLIISTLFVVGLEGRIIFLIYWIIARFCLIFDNF